MVARDVPNPFPRRAMRNHRRLSKIVSKSWHCIRLGKSNLIIKTVTRHQLNLNPKSIIASLTMLLSSLYLQDPFDYQVRMSVL